MPDKGYKEAFQILAEDIAQCGPADNFASAGFDKNTPLRHPDEMRELFLGRDSSLTGKFTLVEALEKWTLAIKSHGLRRNGPNAPSPKTIAELFTLMARVYREILTTKNVLRDHIRAAHESMLGIMTLMNLDGYPTLEEAMLDHTPYIWDALWYDRNFLAGGDAREVYLDRADLRTSLSAALCNFLYLSETRGRKVSLKSHAAHLSVFGWFHEPPGDYDTANRFLPVFGSLASNSDGLASLQKFAKEIVVDLLGVEAFIQRVHRDLEDPSIVHEPLARRLQLFADLSLHDEVKCKLFALQSYDYVIPLAERQKHSGNNVLAWDIWSRIACIVRGCNEFGKAKGSTTPIILKHNIARFLARGFYLCCEETHCKGLRHCLAAISDFTTACLVASQLHQNTRNKVFVALRRDAMGEWYPTLKYLLAVPVLPEAKKDHHDLVESWRTFGEALTLDEDRERERYEKETAEARKAALSVCAWKECRFHSEKPSHTLHTCKGCHDVAYCDRLCQMKFVYLCFFFAVVGHYLMDSSTEIGRRVVINPVAKELRTSLPPRVRYYCTGSDGNSHL
ncbi:hypothetical protein OF83DRAFT_1151289 [Amylostereum chailletii]|nr:hypothetical protein OF83DRAFT_1151289 [Amylostereum chailletii]